MNDWSAAVARYVAAFAECAPRITEEQLRRVTDALNELKRQHYVVLTQARERAARARAGRL